MKNIALIQARTGSTRLPGKVLMLIQDKPMLEHIIERLNFSENLTESVVVTSIEPDDLKIVRMCSERGVRVVPGSVNDVLDRYYQTARLLQADNIIRITADCPLADPSLVDELIAIHVKERNSYTSNTLSETFPDGLDVEVISFAALKAAWKNAVKSSEREHVTPYIKNHPKKFKLRNMESPVNLGNKRWTVDEPEDFTLVKKIYECLYTPGKLFRTVDVLKLLEENPEMEEINSGRTRNEGYLHSIAGEQ